MVIFQVFMSLWPRVMYFFPHVSLIAECIRKHIQYFYTVLYTVTFNDSTTKQYIHRFITVFIKCFRIGQFLKVVIFFSLPLH